jgi:hypothetical protein
LRPARSASSGIAVLAVVGAAALEEAEDAVVEVEAVGVPTAVAEAVGMDTAVAVVGTAEAEAGTKSRCQASGLRCQGNSD